MSVYIILIISLHVYRSSVSVVVCDVVGGGSILENVFLMAIHHADKISIVIIDVYDVVSKLILPP